MARSPSLSPIIVTGGCGFTGSHLVDGLLKSEPTQDCDIHVIARSIRNQIPGVTYHQCDITSAEQVQAVFHLVKPKTVFHTACPDSTVLQAATFRKVNVGGARNLLAAANAVQTVQAFVYTSSTSVSHVNTTDAIDVVETDPIVPWPTQHSVYTLTKGEAETMILAANRTCGGPGGPSMLTVAIRPGAIFGERDFLCAGKMVQNARRGTAGYQLGPGKNVYDFVYVENLVHAHILAAQALALAYGKPVPASETRVDGEAFNITNDEPALFWGFQRDLAAAAGYPVKEKDIKSVPFWLAYAVALVSEWWVWVISFGSRQPLVTREAVRNSTMSRTLNGAKAKRILGYKPLVNMEDAVARTGKWFLQEAKEGDRRRR